MACFPAANDRRFACRVRRQNPNVRGRYDRIIKKVNVRDFAAVYLEQQPASELFVVFQRHLTFSFAHRSAFSWKFFGSFLASQRTAVQSRRGGRRAASRAPFRRTKPSGTFFTPGRRYTAGRWVTDLRKFNWFRSYHPPSADKSLTVRLFSLRGYFVAREIQICAPEACFRRVG